MVAQLYSADLMDIAKPVKKVSESKKSKKIKKQPEPVETTDDESKSLPEQIEEKPEPVKKEKKPRTEKQIAATERAKEARLLKKHQAIAEKQEAEIAEQEAILKEKEEMRIKEEKKAARNEKRKQTRARKISEQSSLNTIPENEENSQQNVELDGSTNGNETTVDTLEQPKPKRVRKRKPVPTPDTSVEGQQESSENNPPAWFKKFVNGAMQEDNANAVEKKSSKQVKDEAKEFAENHWKEPMKRDMVNAEKDSHLEKMVSQTKEYSMMFSHRKMNQ